MRIIRIFGAIASFGLGAFLLFPVISVVWFEFAPGNQGAITSVSVQVAGYVLTGWKMWLFFGGLAVVGLMFVFLGIYLLHSQKTDDES